MTSVTNLLRTTALLSIVTTVKCVTSWDTAPKSNNSSTLIKRLTQPVNTVARENFDNNPRRVFNSTSKFRTNFEDDKITQKMLADNNKQYHDFHPNFHPPNVFKCPPCVCYNINSNSVSVLCQDCSVKSIPQNWSVEIKEIIINNCGELDELDLRSLLMYTSLTRVKIMTYYVLSKVFFSNPLNVSSTMIDLDLNDNLISIIEENCFAVFPNLLKLSLSNNNIKNLTKEMFTGLRRLRYLSVAGNNINFIAHNTFDDMGKLVTLDMSCNEIIYTDYDLLPVHIFIPLKNLKLLYINDVCQRDTYLCGSYPNKALQVLTNLKFLSISGSDSRGLGPELKTLVHLRHLIITYPNTDNVSDDSYFDNAPSLTTLKFFVISQNIPPKAFAKLTSLVNLTYSSIWGNKNLCKFLSDIKYLRNSSLKYLTLSEVNNRYTGCKELKAKQAVYLKLFNLIELNLSGNFLVGLSRDFIAMLPQTLQKIDLSRNSLSYRVFHDLPIFPIEILEINLNNQFIDFVARQNGEDNNNQLKVKDKIQTNKSEILTLIVTESFFEDPTVETIRVSIDMLPPKLEILRADQFKNFGKYLGMFFYSNNCSLKKLSLASSDVNDWTSGYFLTSIEMADFSNNNAKILRMISSLTTIH